MKVHFKKSFDSVAIAVYSQQNSSLNDLELLFKQRLMDTNVIPSTCILSYAWNIR